MKKTLLLSLLLISGCGGSDAPSDKPAAQEKKQAAPETQDGIIVTIAVSPMHEIVQGNDLEGAMRYIEEGGNVNRVAPNGNTFLHEAVSFGHLEMVMLLVDNGALVDAPAFAKDTTWTPLRIALQNGYYDIATFLIENGANFENDYPNGETLLHHTARAGLVSMSRVLLARGIDVNALNNSGVTALRIAVLRGHLEIVKLIFETGEVEASIESNDISMLLELAELMRHDLIISFLSERR